MSDQYENIDKMNYPFKKDEIESFIKTKQDFLDGKTTAREWPDIETDLNTIYKVNS